MPEFPGTLKPPRLASPPASPALGQLYYDTGTNGLYYWNGTSWIALVVGGGLPPTQQIFLTGSGTYTTPAGVKAIIVECLGAGGGGGGCPASGLTTQASIGGPGGSGAFAQKLIANPAATYAYAVGAGGAGGLAGANAGTAGNDTTFGATVVVAKAGAGGGAGMVGGTAPLWAGGGVGGAAASSTGDVVVDGGANVGIRLSGTVANAITPQAPGPYGGSSTRGGVTAGAGGGPGGAGLQYGGGGLPGVDTNNIARAGGNGAGGIIVVTEFYGVTLPKAPTQQVFLAAASGTYTTPAGCRAIRVECWGGGGGGGGAALTAAGQAASGTGGGGGAYAMSLIQNPAATYAYTVGAGGAGGVAGANAGGAGANTTFGTTIVVAAAGAPGAGGASVATVNLIAGGGAGGSVASSTGAVAIAGGAGDNSMTISAGYPIPARGGLAPGTAQTNRAGIAQTSAGVAATTPGGGGGGAWNQASQAAAVAGAAGGPGMIVVTEYY